MRFLGPEELESTVRFSGDGERWTEEGQLILTLMEVQQIVGEGRLGFEESDREDARCIKRPLRGSAEDKNAWWDLGGGAYWISYNEKVAIPAGCFLFLQPDPLILRNGLWHPTLIVRDWEKEIEGMMLVVGARGVRIQEDFPVSRGLMIESGQARP